MELKDNQFIKSNKRKIKNFMKEEIAIFSSNFYTELYNINTEEKLPKFTIEATVMGLEGDLLKNIELLFTQENQKSLTYMFKFINTLTEYLTESKNWDREYEVAQKYWYMANKINKENIENNNKWLVHLQKNTYTYQKGWKN